MGQIIVCAVLGPASSNLEESPSEDFGSINLNPDLRDAQKMNYLEVKFPSLEIFAKHSVNVDFYS